MTNSGKLCKAMEENTRLRAALEESLEILERCKNAGIIHTNDLVIIKLKQALEREKL